MDLNWVTLRYRSPLSGRVTTIIPSDIFSATLSPAAMAAMGLVSLSALSRLASVPTPTIDLMIHLACLVRGENYWETGRTLQSMGVGGLNVAGVLRYVETGSTV